MVELTYPGWFAVKQQNGLWSVEYNGSWFMGVLYEDIEAADAREAIEKAVRLSQEVSQ